MTTIIRILLGLILLITGRRLYWIFVGVIGFVVGLSLSTLIFTTESELALLAIALVAGVLCALLSVFLGHVVVCVAGFVAGGYFATLFLIMLGWEISLPGWLLFLIGGIIGAILVAILFDWALILLSSLMGAILLVQTLDVSQWISVTLFVISFAIGAAIQTSGMHRERPLS